MFKAYSQLLELKRREEVLSEKRIRLYNKLGSHDLLIHHLFHDFLGILETSDMTKISIKDKNVYFNKEKNLFTYAESPSSERIDVNQEPNRFFGNSKKLFSLTIPEWYSAVCGWLYSMRCQRINKRIKNSLTNFLPASIEYELMLFFQDAFNGIYEKEKQALEELLTF